MSQPMSAAMLLKLAQAEIDNKIRLQVTHSNVEQSFIEIHVHPHATLRELKEIIRDRSGMPVESIDLELHDGNNAKICNLLEDGREIGHFSPLDGYRIHVIDKNPTFSSVETFREYREKKLAENPIVSKFADDYMADLAANIKVGDRCKVEPFRMRGEVKFVGKVDTLDAGYWVGVQYDHPVGRHDGVVKGKRFFSSPPRHGSMLRPDSIEVGDFPEVEDYEPSADVMLVMNMFG